MQIFLPYKDVKKVAQCLDRLRFNKQILECHQLLRMTSCNHPVYKMYFPVHEKFVLYYLRTLEAWRDCDTENFEIYGAKANKLLPDFATKEFCDQMKRRLYTKNPTWYNLWSAFGVSEDNWYYVDSKWKIYRNGKIISED